MAHELLFLVQASTSVGVGGELQYIILSEVGGNGSD